MGTKEGGGREVVVEEGMQKREAWDVEDRSRESLGSLEAKDNREGAPGREEKGVLWSSTLPELFISLKEACR